MHINAFSWTFYVFCCFYLFISNIFPLILNYKNSRRIVPDNTLTMKRVSIVRMQMHNRANKKKNSNLDSGQRAWKFDQIFLARLMQNHFWPLISYSNIWTLKSIYKKRKNFRPHYIIFCQQNTKTYLYNCINLWYTWKRTNMTKLLCCSQWENTYLKLYMYVLYTQLHMCLKKETLNTIICIYHGVMADRENEKEKEYRKESSIRSIINWVVRSVTNKIESTVKNNNRHRISWSIFGHRKM